VTHCHVTVVAHRQPPVRHDDPFGGTADRHGHRFSGPDEHEARRLGLGRVAYPERQAVEYLVADRRTPAGSERLLACVAQLRQVDWLVIGHVMHFSWRHAGRPQRRRGRKERRPER